MSINRRSYHKSFKKKKTLRKRIFTWILAPILVLALSATAYGAFLYNKAESVMDKSYKPVERKSTKRDTAVNPKVDNISVLFIGVDASMKRGLEGARSDALMLATFNEKAKSVKLVSIPRDSYVYIPEVGRKDKINHAHAFGGPAATISTLEELLDIPIDFYVKVNFNAFIDLVDALGGIEAEVPYTLTEQDSQDHAGAITLQEGLQNLNGEQALALARTRHYDNDIERGKRQQQILKAIVMKALSAGSVSKYSDLIEAVGKNMETDLSFNQMKSFFDYAKAGTSIDIEPLTLEGSDLWQPTPSGRVYYYDIDQAKLADLQTTLKVHLGLATSTDPTPMVDDTADSTTTTTTDDQTTEDSSGN